MRLTKRRQELAAKYWPLARNLAKRFKAAYPKYVDEFDSAASVRLVECAGAFDRAHGIAFATYARHRIIWALRDVERTIYRDSLNRERLSLKVFDGTHPAEAEAMLESLDEIERLMLGLPESARDLYRQAFLEGATYREIAAKIGTTPHAVRGRVYKARKAYRPVGYDDGKNVI